MISTRTFIIGFGASIGPKCVMPWMSAVIDISTGTRYKI
jgi:hypothetical protein